jgi:hypothetical protein
MHMNQSEKLLRGLALMLVTGAGLLRMTHLLHIGAAQGLFLLSLILGSIAHYSYSRRLKFRVRELEAQLHQLHKS